MVYSKKTKAMHGVAYFFAFLWAAITLLPFIITFFSSFKTNNEIALGMFQLPKQWSIQNYVEAINGAHALTAVKNSMIVAVLTTILTIVLGMMSAYVISRKKVRINKWLFILFTMGVMVPVHCTIVPISGMATQIGAKDNYLFLVLIYIAFNLSQAIFLFSGFLDGIDREIDEAAIIDGCGDLRLLVRILFPLCVPIIATEAIFVFISSYSELIFSLVLISDSKMYTISRAMLSFTGQHSTSYGPQFAFIIVAMIPTLIVYLLFHEKVESGMLSGAIKG